MSSKNNFPYNFQFKLKLTNIQKRKNRDFYEQVAGQSGRCTGDINYRINNYVNFHLQYLLFLIW